MNESILLPILTLTAILIMGAGGFSVLARFYRRVRPGHAMLVYGPQRHPRVLFGGGAVVLPITYRAVDVSLQIHEFDYTAKVDTTDGPLELAVKLRVGLRPETEALRAAVQQLGEDPLREDGPMPDILRDEAFSVAREHVQGKSRDESVAALGAMTQAMEETVQRRYPSLQPRFTVRTV